MKAPLNNSIGGLILGAVLFMGLHRGHCEPYDSTHIAFKQRYSPACCLHYIPVDAYGNPKPLLNQLLFDSCPDKATPEVVCEAATKRLASPPSILAPSKRKSMLAESQSFIYGHALSPVKADLAAVDNGCCYNIYLDVKPGTKLSSECVNPLLGSNQHLIKSIFETSVISAGDVEMVGSYPRSVVIGGDFTSGSSSPTSVAENYFGGPYENAGLVIAGSVINPGGPISVDKGRALLGGADTEGRIRTSTPILVLEDTAKAIHKIQAQICAMSKRIASLESNSYALFEIIPGDMRNPPPDGGGIGARRLIGDCDIADPTCQSDASPQHAPRQLAPAPTTIVDYLINFTCASGVDPCVFNITAEDLNNANGIVFTAYPTNTLKINVSGRLIKTSGLNLVTSTMQVPRNHVIWNMFEAERVSLLFSQATSGPIIDPVPALWPGSVICPQCTLAEVNGAGLLGTVAVGSPSSRLYIHNGDNFGDTQPSFSTLSNKPFCPEPEVNVTYCHCLCPDHDPGNEHSYSDKREHSEL